MIAKAVFLAVLTGASTVSSVLQPVPCKHCSATDGVEAGGMPAGYTASIVNPQYIDGQCGQPAGCGSSNCTFSAVFKITAGPSAPAATDGHVEWGGVQKGDGGAMAAGQVHQWDPVGTGDPLPALECGATAHSRDITFKVTIGGATSTLTHPLNCGICN